jgi:hypothetical protein
MSALSKADFDKAMSLQLQIAEKDAEIARLRKRCALLQSLLGEGIRAGYFDPAKCSPSWLLEVNREIAIFAGMPPKNS